MPPETSAAAVLGWTARALAMASKTGRASAVDWLVANGAPAAAVWNVKAPIGGVDGDLGDHGISIAQWADSARIRSAFYRILSDGGFVRIPFRTHIGLATSTASGAIVPEGAAVPVSKVTLGNVMLEPTKAASLIVATDTLMADISAGGQSLLSRELLGVVSDSVDMAFIAAITGTGTPMIASTSPSADLRAALLAVNSGSAGRLYWIASVDTAKMASTLSTTAGGMAFQAASAAGGELAGLPLLVSGGLADGALALVDAAGIAANGLGPTVSVSTQADILMDTAPPMNSTTPTAAQMVSMFQTNSTALQAVAWFGAEKIRDDSVAMVHGITWGA